MSSQEIAPPLIPAPRGGAAARAPKRSVRGPMVVLHVLSPAPFGGLESVMRALAVGHRSAGHRVHVAAVLGLGQPEGDLPAALRSGGVEVHLLRVSGRDYRGERQAIAELCSRLRPDVFHTHGYRPDVVDAGAARRLGIPTVTTVHGFTGNGWKGRIYEAIQRRAFRRFDAVVAVSRPIVRRLSRSGIAPERLHLLPNAWMDSAERLDTGAAREALGVGAGRPHLGWVGRLSREKGCDVMLRAVSLLGDAGPVASVLGDGAERKALQQHARALGVADRVRWHGTLPDAARLFPAFDLLVLSSRTEGTPMVLLEAMASGVPIVAARVGGVPDMLSREEAWLVPPEDPAALAEAVRAALANPDEAAARARAARRRLRAQYDVAPWLDRYEALYHALQTLPRDRPPCPWSRGS